LAKGWEGHNEAMRLWNAGELPQGRKSDLESELTGHGEQTPVNAILDAFLTWKEGCSGFDDIKRDMVELGAVIGHMTVAEVRHGGAAKIKAFANAKNWNDGSKALFYARVKAAFNHATDKSEDSLGWITSSPIKSLNTGTHRVEAAVREEFFTRPQIAALMAAAAKSTRCPQFAIALKMCLAMPCRPGEFSSVTAADVKRDEHGHLFWEVWHKNKRHTKKRRRVYHVHPSMDPQAVPLFTQEELEAITLAAAAEHPTGPIFRNAYGNPWTKENLEGNFRRLCQREECKALGLDEIANNREIAAAKKVGERPPKTQYRYVLYTARHTYSVECAKIGWPFERTADLQGNSPAMQAKIYAKVHKTTGDFISKLRG
jgi:hypothetical protein